MRMINNEIVLVVAFIANLNFYFNSKVFPTSTKPLTAVRSFLHTAKWSLVQSKGPLCTNISTLCCLAYSSLALNSCRYSRRYSLLLKKNQIAGIKAPFKTGRRVFCQEGYWNKLKITGRACLKLFKFTFRQCESGYLVAERWEENL